MAELYSALVMVAVTLALSYLIFTHVGFTVTGQPIFVASMYQRYGSPSVLLLSVNSSAPTMVNEFRVDTSSSLDGVLALAGGGYTTLQSLCRGDVTTFFSVNTRSGTLIVAASGAVSIDGTDERSGHVLEGWHELIIADSPSCDITLPGGAQLNYPSTLVSSIPTIQNGPQTFTFLVPFTGSGHTVAVSFNGGVESYEF